jgi:hypothetical protein
VNAVDRSGWTPLHEAARKCHLACCTALLAKGADPRAANLDLATALHFLVKHKAVEEASYVAVLTVYIPSEPASSHVAVRQTFAPAVDMLTRGGKRHLGVFCD